MNNSDNIEVSVLGFLYDQSKHGYDLHKDISDLSGIGIVWRVKMGRLYAMLHRLEKKYVDRTRIRARGKQTPTYAVHHHT